jgi:protein-tyrosine phosphatase
LVGAGEMLTPAFVKKYEITHVINCAEEVVSPTWFKAANPDKYYCINAVDDLHANILKWYTEFKAILRLYLQDPTSKKIFVHCQCGINRSAFLALMYVCDVFKFPLEMTELSVLKQRPCMMTNTSFRQQVFYALSNGKY